MSSRTHIEQDRCGASAAPGAPAPDAIAASGTRTEAVRQRYPA
ncbi:hypothetical protein RR42_m0124 [Cupriavidus basilensis]|uniref:Uncharacterized protein n=1 Tax=Cupriavidus basilensis TaxID=68895 RepID=A0A0C4Y606_9BURK|nr:hypothetical protein RR42_m0124 [Cupriavidus basilensis]